MSEETLSIQVESSWEAGNQRPLKNAVTLAPLSSHKRNEDGALTDMVQLESCVLLSQPAEENGNQDVEAKPCSISLQLEPFSPFLIASVIVVCEARIIEVYGAHNEYLTTVSAELLDEVGDTAVYCAEIDFTRLTQECTLKFARLSKSMEMWLYGVKVLWNIQKDSDKMRTQTIGVNFETVDQRLRESQRQLSGRAESCKQFLKMYSSLPDGKKSLQGFPDPVSLLSLIPAMSRSPTLQKRIGAGSFLNETNSANTSTVSDSKHLWRESDRSICNGCSEKMESFLENKLVSMENRIMEALDVKLTALKEHQDRQMQSLFGLLENAFPLGGKLKPKANSETACQAPSEEDLKIELAIKNIFDGNLYSLKQESMYRKNTSDGNADNILRNAFMALKLDKMIAETSCQSEIDSVPTVVQNSS